MFSAYCLYFVIRLNVISFCYVRFDRTTSVCRNDNETFALLSNGVALEPHRWPAQKHRCHYDMQSEGHRATLLVFKGNEDKAATGPFAPFIRNIAYATRPPCRKRPR